MGFYERLSLGLLFACAGAGAGAVIKLSLSIKDEALNQRSKLNRQPMKIEDIPYKFSVAEFIILTVFGVFFTYLNEWL